MIPALHQIDRGVASRLTAGLSAYTGLGRPPGPVFGSLDFFIHYVRAVTRVIRELSGHILPLAPK
jgi:hypothetical protein